MLQNVVNIIITQGYAQIFGGFSYGIAAVKIFFCYQIELDYYLTRLDGMPLLPPHKRPCNVPAWTLTAVYTLS